MKSTKLFRNGARLKDIYVGATRWQVFKFKLARFMRKLILRSLLVGGWVAMIAVLIHFNAATADVEIPADTLGVKVSELKEDVLNKIQNCERAGHSEDDGIIIFDSNNKASIGTFQFQKATVIYYYKALYGQDITPKEAVLIALDNTKARDLARDVVFGKKANGLSNWYNCSQKHGLEAQVNIISKLEK